MAAQKNGSKAELQAEFGDLLFALVQLARKLGFSAEEIMDNACQKFQRRFEVIEERAGADIKSKTAAEFNDLWLEAKKTVG